MQLRLLVVKGVVHLIEKSWIQLCGVRVQAQPFANVRLSVCVDRWRQNGAELNQMGQVSALISRPHGCVKSSTYAKHLVIYRTSSTSTIPLYLQ